MTPTRYSPSAAIRARFGDRCDRLAPFLMDGDPVADDAVEALAKFSAPQRVTIVDDALARGIDSVPGAPDALHRFFGVVEHVPVWWDRDRGDRGGAVLLKSGVLGGLVLGARSLIAGYCSPAGNKPLTFSGRLNYDVPRRLAETARFVQVTSMPGGMERRAEGFRATVKVRLMHAQVRRMLLKSPKWHNESWGLPINQFDMAGTGLLFSHVLTEGLRLLGYPLSDAAVEDNLHLWRYASWLMGVREELLSTSIREARDLWDQISETQGKPDDDSRALAKAMLEHPLAFAKTPRERVRAERGVAFAYALSRHLLGDEYADALGYPKTPWRHSIRAMRMIVNSAESLRRGVPGTDALALRLGTKYWDDVVKMRTANAAGETFGMPDRLGAA